AAGAEPERSRASLLLSSFSSYDGISQGRSPDGWRGNARVEFTDDFNATIEMLDEGGARLDPIAAGVIGNAPKLANGDVVDMSTKNSVNPVSLGVLYHGGLELADKANGIFDALFDVGTE